jgi:hypothetical protein
MARKRRRAPGSLLKAAELAIAAPQVVAIRTARMLAAGPNPNARDRAEFSKMGTEKVQAFWESMFAMGRQVAKTNQEYTSQAVRQWMGVWTNPWWLAASPFKSRGIATFPRWRGSLGPTRGQRQRAMSKLIEHGLTPVHKRATANARRLSRVKK